MAFRFEIFYMDSLLALLIEENIDRAIELSVPIMKILEWSEFFRNSVIRILHLWVMGCEGLQWV